MKWETYMKFTWSSFFCLLNDNYFDFVAWIHTSVLFFFSSAACFQFCLSHWCFMYETRVYASVCVIFLYWMGHCAYVIAMRTSNVSKCLYSNKMVFKVAHTTATLRTCVCACVFTSFSRHFSITYFCRLLLFRHGVVCFYYFRYNVCMWQLLSIQKLRLHLYECVRVSNTHKSTREWSAFDVCVCHQNFNRRRFFFCFLDKMLSRNSFEVKKMLYFINFRLIYVALSLHHQRSRSLCLPLRRYAEIVSNCA